MVVRSSRAFLSLMALLTAVGCLPSMSKVVVQQLAGSENIATIEKRDSGAMSRGSTLVSIRLITVPDNDTHGTIVLELNGDKALNMKWIDPHHLAISCASCRPQDVDFEVVKIGDVLVTYDSDLRTD